MPATNYTPIQLYRTNTASTTAPSGANLNAGELAINYNDSGMILFAKNTTGTVIKLMNNPANLLYPTADGTSGQFISTNGSGTLSFVSGASLASPLAVTGNSSEGASIRLPEDTDNGTNYVALKAPDSLSADFTCTLPATTATLGYLNLPAVGTKTGSYTLAVGDVGKYVQVGSGGSITIPDATFAEGDVVIIANNTSGNITITCTITTAYIAGTDSDKASVTLATRGLANIVFLSSTVCIISGNVS